MPSLTSDEFAARARHLPAGGRGHLLRLVFLILRVEPIWGWTGLGGPAADSQWIVSFDRRIRVFRGVVTIDEYWDRRPKPWEARRCSLSVDESAGHAFISYVREDSDRVDGLQRDLEAAGIPVWRDTANLWPGQDWRRMIRRAITGNALVFLACFSSQSLARRQSYQNEELALAVEQLRLRQPDDPWLIPIRLDDCEMPDLDIGAGRTLGSIQRADLYGDRCGEGMKRLVTSIRRLLLQTPSGEDTGAKPAQPIPSTAPGVQAAGARPPAAVHPLTYDTPEPEAASVYRQRPMGAQRQAERAREIESEAFQRLDISSAWPWVVVSLVPELPGQLSISSQVLGSFRERIVGQPMPVVLPLTGDRFTRASVGRRRLLADGATEGPLAKGVSLELHADGSGVFGMCVPNLASRRQQVPPQDGPSEAWIQDESLVIAVLSGLLLFGPGCTGPGGGGRCRAGARPDLSHLSGAAGEAWADPPIRFPRPAW